MQKILVTGGAGYIGSHVARALLDRGFAVVVFDNLSTGSRQNLFAEAEFIQGDILDTPHLVKAMRQSFSAVVHLASKKAPGESMLKPELYLENITGDTNILHAAVETGINQIVFSSSAAVYGSPRYLPIDEDHPTEPESFYGYTKLEMEHLLKWFERLKGIRFVALRYFNAVGYDPAQRITGVEKFANNVLPRIMEVATGKQATFDLYGDDYPTKDGTCIRDYVHVSDLAEAHVTAIDYLSGNGPGLILNLGSETGYSVLQLLTKVRQVTGQPIPVRHVDRRPGDPPVNLASAKKAAELLNWKPKHSDLDTIVQTMWAVYNKK